MWNSHHISRCSSFTPQGSDKPISDIQIFILYMGRCSKNAGCYLPHHSQFLWRQNWNCKIGGMQHHTFMLTRGFTKGGCLVKLAESSPTSLTPLVLRRSHQLRLFVGVAVYRLKPLCQRHTFPPADKHAPNDRSAYFLESLEACQYQALSPATTDETVLQWVSAGIVASEKSIY